MKLEELIKETDALTYINSLKVTLTEMKGEISTIEEHREYTHQACERVKKLMRKADNQYRVIAKLAQQGPGIVANSISIDENTQEEIQKLMEEIDG